MWYQFEFLGYHVNAKIYDLGSQYGISGGRISKLELRRRGRVVAHYDRGWDLNPVDAATQNAVNALVNLYSA